MRTALAIGAALLSFGAGRAAAELAEVSAAELHASCLSYNEAPQAAAAFACAWYVRGFIDGAVAAEQGALKRATERESFSDRALRTRLGQHSGEPAYCIRESSTLDEVIAQLLQQTEERPPAPDASAYDLLTATLLRFHRCDR